MKSWFTNKCMAYVDGNGRALSGPALEAAHADPKAKRCGEMVKIRAKFCRACGSSAPAGWWRCGGCGRWIGSDANACTYCGHTLNPAARIDLDNGVWQKGDDVFAQRFELNDVECLLERGLVIREGQCAILLLNGRIEATLPPGRYPKEELVDLQTYLRRGDRKSLVMVELSEISFPVLCSGLRSREDMDVKLTCSVVLQFDPQRAEAFLSNVMGNHLYVSSDKPNALLGYDELARNLLVAEVEIAARDLCNEHSVDALFKEPKLRLELEDRIASQLRRNLDAAGLAFRRLSEVEFSGSMFERLRTIAGDVEVRRREREFELRMDELAIDSKKREAMNDAEIKDFIAQVAQEKDIKDHLRQRELDHLLEMRKRDLAIADLGSRYEQAKKELTDTSELEVLQAKHDEELKAIIQGGEMARCNREHALLLEQRLSEQRAALEYERIEIEMQAMRQKATVAAAIDQIELEKTQRASERLDEMERAKTLSTLDVMTRISLAKTPAEAHYLLKTLKATQRDGKDPMQLLAEAAADGSGEAAEALKNLASDKIAMLEAVRKGEREIMEKNQEMMERMFNKATEALAQGNSPKIIK